MIDLQKNAERVLLHVGNRPAKAKEIAGDGIAPATVFRHLKTLLGHGLVTVDDQGIYSLTKRGRAWIDARNDGTQIAPELPIPAIAMAPSPVHRSVLTIGMCGAAARTHAVETTSLGGLLLYGDSGAFKTTTGETFVGLAGGDPEKDVVDAAVESGRGLLVRRDARGGEVTRCHLLTAPVAMFDETDKVDDPKAKKVLENTYFGGTATVTFGGEVYAMKCIPIGTLNPVREGASSFTEVTGFHESRERRVILVRVPKVDVPVEDMEVSWKKALLEADRTRHPKLPVPRNPGLEVAARFKAIIELVTRDAEAAKRVDPYLLRNLARGATAWLDDERAVRLVAFHWTRLAATTGVCHDDWESRLELHFAPREVLKARRARKRLLRGKRLYDATKEHLGGDVARAIEVIRLAGSLRREAPILEIKMAKIGRAVVEDLGGDADLALDLLKGEAVLRSRGLTTAQARDIARLAQDDNIRGQDIDLAFELMAELKKRGLEPRTALWLAERAKTLELSLSDALDLMDFGLEVARRGYTLSDLPGPRARQRRGR